jgi:hypothetical protein
VPGVRANESGPTVAALLHKAAETYHVVYRITGGDDADWLLDRSELPELLGGRPVRSHLVHALVQLDRDYTSAHPAEPWENWYAARLPEALAGGSLHESPWLISPRPSVRPGGAKSND